MCGAFAGAGGRAAGGSAVFVGDRVVHSSVPLAAGLQAVAVRLSLDGAIGVCSVYIPPSSVLCRGRLVDLVGQLPRPFVILGGFGARGPLWGGGHANDKGRGG